MAIQDTEKEHRTYNEMPTEGRYPLQQVMQMEGGHRIIVSNDPQSPYVAFFHTSGSHTIYRPDGSLDNFTVGNSRSYNKSGASVTVDNNNDMHIAGHQKIHVEGGGHIEISGDANIVAGGKINAIALAGMGISAKGNIYFGAEQGISLNAPSGLTIVGDVGIQGNLTMTGDIQNQGSVTSDGTHLDKIGGHMPGASAPPVPPPNIKTGTPNIS